jgi:hypothetical protein
VRVETYLRERARERERERARARERERERARERESERCPGSTKVEGWVGGGERDSTDLFKFWQKTDEVKYKRASLRFRFFVKGLGFIVNGLGGGGNIGLWFNV